MEVWAWIQVFLLSCIERSTSVLVVFEVNGSGWYMTINAGVLYNGN